jgi:hypothetical protein
MVDWYITTKADANLEELEAKFAEWGCERTGLRPIPLDRDEQVIEVSGPADLPKKVHDKDPIIKVSPNSPPSKYLILGDMRPS